MGKERQRDGHTVFCIEHNLRKVGRSTSRLTRVDADMQRRLEARVEALSVESVRLSERFEGAIPLWNSSSSVSFFVR